MYSHRYQLLTSRYLAAKLGALRWDLPAPFINEPWPWPAWLQSFGITLTAASPAGDDPRPIQVRDIYLHKVRGHPYWPVQVCRVEEDTISLVYYETGETNVVPKSSADFVPFTQQNIANLKLDQLKSRKLQKAIAAAKASMWVGINSILISENDSALSIALVCNIVS